MHQPIKILHVIASLSVGGAERLLLNLSRRIDRSRFAFHVCSLGVLRGNPLQQEFEQVGLPLTVIASDRFYDPRAVTELARYIRANQIDIVHTHLTSADVIGRLAARLAGRPVVSTMHNEPQDYDKQRLDRRLLQRFTARYLTTRLVTVSPTNRRQYSQAWRIPERRIESINTAIMMDAFLDIPAERERAPGEGPVITNIGRLNPQKAQRLLLNAMKLVLELRPDARLMIVGQGRLEQELKQHAQTIGIAARVEFTGLRRDIPAVLAASDIFVNSSLWEGLPQTAIEAMAAARPSVLTDVGGLRDVAEQSTHALFVPPGDVPALAEALLALLNDPARGVAMGLAARARVRHEFDIDIIARQYEALYASIVSRKVSVGNAAQARR